MYDQKFKYALELVQRAFPETLSVVLHIALGAFSGRAVTPNAARIAAHRGRLPFKTAIARGRRVVTIVELAKAIAPLIDDNLVYEIQAPPEPIRGKRRGSPRIEKRTRAEGVGHG